MAFFNWLGRSVRTRTSASLTRRFRPRLEDLESRVVPYTASGNLWPNPQLVTLSFMPDGTNIGGQTSNLFATFNAKFGSATTWENVILKAAQQWAQQTNLNFAVVPDSGAPDGSGSYQQGDPTMGDIRIGGYNFGTTTLAQAFMPPPVNNYSLAGDIQYNTAQTFNIGSTYDLFTVSMHEFGHALGLLGSSTISAAMYETYSGVKSGLASDDIAGIRNLYSNNNPRSQDQYGGLNNSFANAADLTSSINLITDTALVTGLNIAQAAQKEYFKLTAPLLTGSTVTIDVQSQGLSLLAPTVTVYAADQVTVLGSASGYGQYGTTLTVNLTNKVSPGQVIYLKVGGADNTAFGTGTYALTMSFAGLPLPTVPLPNTQVLNGFPLSGGGGQPNADSFEYQVPTVGTLNNTYVESPNAVALDKQGDYVVTWSSYTAATGWSVYAQRYDANGNALSDPFQVNTTATGNQLYPTVACDAAGDFVITWSSYGQGKSGWGIFAQRYDANGNRLGSEFQVNTTTTGDQLYSTVAMDAMGDFIITWSGFNPDGSGQGIFAQRYNANGNAVGGQVQVNTTPGYQAYSTVAMDPNGDAVVTWSSYGQDGSGWGVYGQRYDSAGNPLGREFQINTTTAGDQEYSSVAMAGDGSFVVVWSSKGQGKSGWGIYGQRFDAFGNPLGGEFKANTTNTNDQEYGTVAMNTNGDFLVTWSSDGGGGAPKNVGLIGQTVVNTTNSLNLTLSGATSSQSSSKTPTWGIYGQEFNGDDGSPNGTEFQVNSTTSGSHQYSSVAMDSSGHIVVAWSGTTTAGSQGIFIQRYVLGADALSAPDVGASSDMLASPGAARGNQVSEFTGSHPDVRQLPASLVAPAVITVWSPGTNPTIGGAPVTSVAAVAAQTLTGVSDAGSPARTAVLATATPEAPAQGGSANTAVRLDDAPEQLPEKLEEDVAPGTRGGTVEAVTAEPAQGTQATDAWFAETDWAGTTTEGTEELATVAQAGEAILEHPGAMALILTGLLGTFHVDRAEEAGRRKDRAPAVS